MKGIDGQKHSGTGSLVIKDGRLTHIWYYTSKHSVGKIFIDTSK